MHIEVGSRLTLRYFTTQGHSPSTIWVVDRIAADMYPDPRLDELMVFVHAEDDPRKRMQSVWYHFAPVEHEVEEMVH